MSKKITFFALALVAQTAILAAVPAKKIHARLTGTLITLKTAPVDPYSFLSGYHETLRYEITTPPGLEEFPHRNRGTEVYVLLEPDENNIYNARSVHESLPEDVPPNGLFIKGKLDGPEVKYGIESYFIPEKNRSLIEKDLRDNQRQATAQIKVDKYGNACLIRLLVEDRIYEY
jgi:uncharacterized membrane-anchored protein